MLPLAPAAAAASSRAAVLTGVLAAAVVGVLRFEVPIQLAAVQEDASTAAALVDSDPAPFVTPPWALALGTRYQVSRHPVDQDRLPSRECLLSLWSPYLGGAVGDWLAWA